MCACLTPLGTSGEVKNQVAFVFNVLLSTLIVDDPSSPTNSAQCSGAVYTPLAASYVCSQPGQVCICPTSQVHTWNETVSHECRTWLNDGPAHLGKCLPSSLGTNNPDSSCQLQACECEAPGALPSPEASPAPSPSPSPQPSPSPSPTVSPSPSPGPVSPSPSLLPSPSPQPGVSAAVFASCM
jgi:hypothetical protein